jgi:hypothetical protein
MIDAKAEAEKAAALLNEALSSPLATAEDVLRRGRQLHDVQLRIARGLVVDNSRAASTIVARAHASLVELHARAFKVVGSDAQLPSIVDNSVCPPSRPSLERENARLTLAFRNPCGSRLPSEIRAFMPIRRSGPRAD